MKLDYKKIPVDPRLLGGALLLLCTALLLPAWNALETAQQSAARAERRLIGIQELAARHQALYAADNTSRTASIPLFTLFNRQIEAAGLKGRVERVQPRPSTDAKQPERLEARLTDVHQESAIRLLAALEQESTLESLTLTRTPKGLLNVDLVLAAGARP